MYSSAEAMELGAAGYAAAGAATAGGVGVGLFGYNRANYMMDQKHASQWSCMKACFATFGVLVQFFLSQGSIGLGSMLASTWPARRQISTKKTW